MTLIKTSFNGIGSHVFVDSNLPMHILPIQINRSIDVICYYLLPFLCIFGWRTSDFMINDGGSCGNV